MKPDRAGRKGFILGSLLRLVPRPHIVRKILAGYLTLALLIVVISVFSLASLDRMNRMHEHIVQRDVPLLEVADRMLDSLFAQELYARRSMILKSPDMVALFWERSREFDRAVDAGRGLPGVEGLPFEPIESLHEEYNGLLIDAMRSPGPSEEAQARMKEKQEKLIAIIKEISSRARQSQHEKTIAAASIGASAFAGASFLTVAGLAVSIVAALVITRSISRSIDRLKGATEAISEGRFEYEVTIDRKDELGELSVAFHEMAKRLKRLEERYLDASPLTRLPGGVAIEHELTMRLAAGMPLAFCLTDLDDFKAFNDKYGYARSSELIKEAARIIEAVVRERGGAGDFVGHIGGDDFVFITTPERYSEICEGIVERFDRMIVNWYDPQDREQGYIVSKNRQGQEMRFPLMTISIAVVTNRQRTLRDPVHVGEIAAELKEYAKSIPKSVFVVDQRRGETLPARTGDNVVDLPRKHRT